jgi:hypothetical protein
VRNPCLAAVLTELERAGATALAGKEAEVHSNLRKLSPAQLVQVLTAANQLRWRARQR